MSHNKLKYNPAPSHPLTPDNVRLFIPLLFQKLDAYHEAVGMLDEHLQTSRALQDLDPQEKQLLEENIGTVQQRLKMLHLKQEEVAKDLRVAHNKM